MPTKINIIEIDQVKEKLIELILNTNLGMCIGRRMEAEDIADNLIANGVTINRGTEYTPVGDKVSSTDKPRFLFKENGDIVPLTNCQQWISVKEMLPQEDEPEAFKEYLF